MADKATKQEARSRLFRREPSRRGSFAMTQPHRAKAYVSSSALRKIKERPLATTASQDQAWQAEAYSYADEIGEVGYVLNLKANMVAAASLVVVEDQAVEQEDGNVQWEEQLSLDARAQRVMDALVGPVGGQAELMRRGALQLATAGETYLVGTAIEENGLSLGILWEFLSTEELRVSRGQEYTRRSSGTTGQGQDLPEDSYVARCWRAHARFSDLADSEMRRVLQICKEVVTLTQMVDAIAKSRLNAGIFFVPEEMTLVGEEELEPGAETGELEEGDEPDAFTAMLEEHMAAPVKDRTSAASLVPLIVRGPADLGEKMKLIELSRQLDTWAQELRREALERLATGLDTPPEIMQGKGGLNHWTGYNVDDDFIAKHVVPLGNLLAEFLSYAYLRPMLEEFEGVDGETAARFRIVFDPSTITARPDTAATAQRAYELGELSRDAYLRRSGIDEGEAPSPEERGQRILLDLIKIAPSIFAELITELPGLESVDVTKLHLAAPSEDEAGGGSKASGAGVPQGIKVPIVDRTSGGGEPSRNQVLLTAELAVATDAAIERALERAGTKLVTKARKDPTLRDRFAQVSKERALQMVRPDELVALGFGNGCLFDGAWDGLAMKARAWIKPQLEEAGMDPLTADERAAFAASQLCQLAGDWARSNAISAVPGRRCIDPTKVAAIVFEAFAVTAAA